MLDHHENKSKRRALRQADFPIVYETLKGALVKNGEHYDYKAGYDDGVVTQIANKTKGLEYVTKIHVQNMRYRIFGRSKESRTGTNNLYVQFRTRIEQLENDMRRIMEYMTRHNVKLPD